MNSHWPPIYCKYKLKRCNRKNNWVCPTTDFSRIIKGGNKSLFIFALDEYIDFKNESAAALIEYVSIHGFDKYIIAWLTNRTNDEGRFLSNSGYIIRWYRHINSIKYLKKIIKILYNNIIDTRYEFYAYVLELNFKAARLFYGESIVSGNYFIGYKCDNQSFYIPDKEKHIKILQSSLIRLDVTITSFDNEMKCEYRITDTIMMKFLGKNLCKLSRWFSRNNIGNRIIPYKKYLP